MAVKTCFQYVVDVWKVVEIVSFQCVLAEVQMLVVDHVVKEVELAWRGHMVDVNQNVGLDDAFDVEGIEIRLDPVAQVVKMCWLSLEPILVAVYNPSDTFHW